MFVNVVVGRLQKNHSILSSIKMIEDFLEDLMNGQMYFLTVQLIAFKL